MAHHVVHLAGHPQPLRVGQPAGLVRPPPAAPSRLSRTAAPTANGTTTHAATGINATGPSGRTPTNTWTSSAASTTAPAVAATRTGRCAATV
ncbi:hypothetical protein ACQP2H_07070 [Micromonospora sp. CA-248260]|uniref:hypothetical protein n=1 Tax=Micromonospora sp. CA-248260 TaxID=3239962 RepID=UPI003D8C1375